MLEAKFRQMCPMDTNGNNGLIYIGYIRISGYFYQCLLRNKQSAREIGDLFVEPLTLIISFSSSLFNYENLLLSLSQDILFVSSSFDWKH